MILRKEFSPLSIGTGAAVQQGGNNILANQYLIFTQKTGHPIGREFLFSANRQFALKFFFDGNFHIYKSANGIGWPNLMEQDVTGNNLIKIYDFRLNSVRYWQPRNVKAGEIIPAAAMGFADTAFKIMPFVNSRGGNTDTIDTMRPDAIVFDFKQDIWNDVTIEAILQNDGDFQIKKSGWVMWSSMWSAPTYWTYDPSKPEQKNPNTSSTSWGGGPPVAPTTPKTPTPGGQAPYQQPKPPTGYTTTGNNTPGNNPPGNNTPVETSTNFLPIIIGIAAAFFLLKSK